MHSCLMEKTNVTLGNDEASGKQLRKSNSAIVSFVSSNGLCKQNSAQHGSSPLETAG